MRLRTAHDRLKVEHSIIEGVREILEELLALNPQIRSVIPGVIRPVRDARGKVKVRVTVQMPATPASERLRCSTSRRIAPETGARAWPAVRKLAQISASCSGFAYGSGRISTA